MYRILTKLHTQSPGIYRMYMVRNEDGELVEYGTNDAREAENIVHNVLSKVGYADLKIVDDRAYYVDIVDVVDHPITDKDIEEALDLLSRVGYSDLDLLNEASYDVDFHWGNRPEEEPETYALNFEGEGVTFSKDFIDGILAGESRTVKVTFDTIPDAFHFKINGDEYHYEYTGSGIPEWISYIPIDDYNGELTINNINQNYVIEVVVDYIIDEPGEIITM